MSDTDIEEGINLNEELEDALRLADRYIQYVRMFYPAVHNEADGLPSTSLQVLQALGEEGDE